MFDSEAVAVENGGGVNNVEGFRGNDVFVELSNVAGGEENVTSIDGNEIDNCLGREDENRVCDTESPIGNVSFLVNHDNVEERVDAAGSNVGVIVDAMDCGNIEKIEAFSGQENEEDVTDNCILNKVYSIGDLVWAKSKGKSWSPAKIWDPSIKRKSVPKSHDTDCFLVRYFGSHNYAWCRQPQLKHFQENFEEMLTHGNSKSFKGALQKALFEFRGRVKLEMTCSCNSHTNAFINAGQVSDEVSDDAEGDKRLLSPNNKSVGYSVTQFEPQVFISYLKNLAKAGSVSSKLECTVIQSRLWAYYCSVGHRQVHLSQLQDVDSLVGDQNPVLDEANLPSNQGKEKEEVGTFSEEGADKYAETGFDLRDRKKSKYLSPPYTAPKGVQDSGADNNIKGSSEGRTLVKCSSKKYQKKLLVKPVDPSEYAVAINKSSAELLSELQMAALDCLYPNKSQHFDSVKTLFSMFRRSVYHDESKKSAGYPLVLDSQDMASPTPNAKPERKKRVKKEGNNPVGVPIPVLGTDVLIPESEISQAVSHTVKPQRKKRAKKEGSAPTPPPSTETTVPTTDLENSQATGLVVKPPRKKRAKKETASVPALVTGTLPVPVLPSGTAEIPVLGIGIAPAPLLATGTTTTILGLQDSLEVSPVVKPKRKKRAKKERTSLAPPLATEIVLEPLLTKGVTLEPFPDTGISLEPFPLTESTTQILDFENSLVIHHPVSKLKPMKRKKEESTLECSSNGATANISLAYLNEDNVKPISLVVDLPMGQQLSSDTQQIATSVNPNTNHGANVSNLNENIISFDTKLQGNKIGTSVSGDTTVGVGLLGVKEFNFSLEPKLPESKKRKRKKKEQATINFQNGTIGVFGLNFNGAEPILLGKDSHEVKPARKRRKKSEDTIMKNNKATTTRKAFRTTLQLTFAAGSPIPSKEILVTMFSRFASFKESETLTFEDSSSAHVVFTENSDAVEAVKYLETDKPFGEALVSYKFQHLSASRVGLESSRNLRIVPISPLDVARRNNNPVSEAPSLSSVRQNLQFMTDMLQKSGDALSADKKAILEAEIKTLMQKVCTITGSSSS